METFCSRGQNTILITTINMETISLFLMSCFPHPGNQEDYNLSSPFHDIRADARMITYAFDHALFLVIHLATACLFLQFKKIRRIKKGWLNELTALSDAGLVMSCLPLPKAR